MLNVVCYVAGFSTQAFIAVNNDINQFLRCPGVSHAETELETTGHKERLLRNSVGCDLGPVSI